MKIKTILVDDEPLARQRMRDLLADHPDIEVTAEFSNGLEAKQQLENLHADLLLLDVQMPRLSGLKLIELLGDQQLPLVIFVTAHDNFAVEAFDTRAVDYLLKPVRPERLNRALTKVRDQLDAINGDTMKEPVAEPAGQPTHIARLMVKSGEQVVFIKSEQIDWIESAGNYVVIQAGDERHIVRETMTVLEKGLPRGEFVRLNRSLIVNVNRIIALKAQGQGEYFAQLTKGKKANVTIGLRELEQKLRYSR